jgi:hypothetical protein
MRKRSIIGVVAVLVALAAALSAFAATRGGTGGARGTAMSGMDMTPAQMRAMGTPATTGAAADLRVALDELLGEHAYLAMYATDEGVGGKPDFHALAQQLDRNSVALSKAIASLYGKPAGNEFLNGKNMWRDHIRDFVAYTVATAKGDRKGRAKAVAALHAYIVDFGTFLAKATGLPPAAVENDLVTHVEQLADQLDGFHAGKYAFAYRLQGNAYDHMFMTGDILGTAIAKQKSLSAGDATSSAVGLRVTLDNLLGQHAILAMRATQKGYDGSADFASAAAALDRNSVALSKAIASVYGKQAGNEFLNGKNMWRDHIRDFVAYTVALKKGDKAGEARAVANLHAYIVGFGTFLAKATGLPPTAVENDLVTHVQQLKNQIDEYAAGHYAAAYRTFDTAYRHMFMTGDVLSAAIVKQSPANFAG